jgi:hypothetical protein
MFNWILCATGPLHINELWEAITFTMDDRHWDSAKLPIDMPRLIRACGNLVVIDDLTLNVAFAHYTVQQYLLGQDGPKSTHFGIQRQEAEIENGQLCFAYLSFSDFETQITQHSDTVTPTLKVLESAVRNQSFLPPNSLAAYAAKALGKVHRRQESCSKIDFSRHVALHRGSPSSKSFMDKYVLLSYIARNWLHHTQEFTVQEEDEVLRNQRHILLFDTVALDKNLLFDFKPWNNIKIDNTIAFVGAVGWALFTGHIPLLQAIDRHGGYKSVYNYLSMATDCYLIDIISNPLESLDAKLFRQRSCLSNNCYIKVNGQHGFIAISP